MSTTATPLRPVEAAAALGLSEAEWLATHAPGPVRALRAPLGAVIQALPTLGPVMALTRNAHCVHEKDGTYGGIELGPVMGRVLGTDIDLRVFLDHWAFGFAVETPLDDGGTRRSLQFFDRWGTAVHKVFARPATDQVAWDALVARFAEPPPAARPQMSSTPPPPERAEAETDASLLRSEWDAVWDVHHFLQSWRRAGAGRLEALRLAGAPHARPVAPSAVRRLLEEAARRAIPLMIVVGNRGAIQIHTGPIRRIVPTGPWLNVLDPGFNLHLRADRVAHAFLVGNPPSDGPVHAVELFDAAGALVAQIMGASEPGRPERADWQAFVTDLARREALA
ncbi:MAG: ChuX/HutX family heme-like substrate-binding protein [Thermaurantiacus sp.]|uniref:hemin-degrading factor n=1 Tax=Thermaurantiacus sp. TaxID=2820283 RepID=UPI00298EDCD1|nr:ChuX/HutX family heme-like substrate-binding protein [Thermaurantiacus sp.]MDW8415737.1 ChuX/HutX family heme-like substrate-binding protein [Thermaurantiacus sp.]